MHAVLSDPIACHGRARPWRLPRICRAAAILRRTVTPQSSPAPAARRFRHVARPPRPVRVGPCLASAAGQRDSLPPPPAGGALATLTLLFPVWTLLGSAAGLCLPATFAPIRGAYFSGGLSFLLLLMGLTIRLRDFGALLSSPRPVLAGLGVQYLCKPLLGWALAALFQLPPPLFAGLVLVAACPGAQASSVAVFIARGAVPVSLIITAVSTLLAVAATPMLTRALAGALVAVDAAALFTSLLTVVALPVAIGLGLNELFAESVTRVRPALPLLGALTTAVLCTGTTANVAPLLLSHGLALLPPVALFHGLCYAAGAAAAGWAGLESGAARAVVLTAGMQSSGTGLVLALAHFGDRAVALPCAVSVVVMATMGAAVAVWLRARPGGDGGVTMLGGPG